MALILQSPALSAIKKLHFPLHRPPHNLGKRRDLVIKFQDSSSSTSKSSSQTSKPAESTTTSSSSAVGPPSPKKQPSSAAGLGFGSLASTKSNAETPTKKKQKGNKERASIIRRAPLEKPSFAAQPMNEVEAEEKSQNESAFLLAWLGLGAIILIQGLVLAASGFLPEEWDAFFVKYMYPSFTPLVFLFVAGTVAYGGLKYLQNQGFNNDN